MAALKVCKEPATEGGFATDSDLSSRRPFFHSLTPSRFAV